MQGDGRDIILQGFHWKSHLGARNSNGATKPWWRIVRENAPAIRHAGFTWVWMPPCSDSLAPQGYIPRRWNVFGCAYGPERELKAALRALGPVGALADVVVNHRVGVHTSGADFMDPPFADNRAAICADDESGVGTGAPDTGERHPCGRDLDHTNPDVRAAVKAYLERLRSLGFRGWRFDLVKGFAGKYVGDYVEASDPGFSVGECYETDRQRVCDWIDSADGRCAAFDFPTRYRLYDAVMRDDYTAMREDAGGKVLAGGLIGYWPSMAVTFVDNHDTEWCREAEHQANYDNTRHFPGTAAEAAYAYTLTHPGVPCVFWQHFFDWGTHARRTIERLMRLRREHDIVSTSALEIVHSGPGLYAAEVGGRVAVKLGWGDWSPGRGWRLEVSGERYAVWAR
ncbi:MAG: alpha-amylase C-terminal beta-sheet domain-containing protein [Gemmataceae bacterium]